MKAALQRLGRLWHFPAMRRWWHRRFGWKWFRGNYRSWIAAKAASVGYDDAAVMNRARDATRAVRAGKGKWERDGAVFAEPAVHPPLLAALRRAALANERRLGVVDIGGAFGSAWWQHRAELADLAEVRWRILEQPIFVEAGREFANDGLSFHLTLEDAGRDFPPHVALLSSVLPYVESPRQLLDEVMARGFEHIIIDRTPFHDHDHDRLTVQHVPPMLGGGSYPSWIFNHSRLVAPLAAGYELVDEWPGFDDVDRRVKFRGFHYRRKTGAVPRHE